MDQTVGHVVKVVLQELLELRERNLLLERRELILESSCKFHDGVRVQLGLEVLDFLVGGQVDLCLAGRDLLPSGVQDGLTVLGRLVFLVCGPGSNT